MLSWTVQINSDLPSLLDEWATSLFRELDYTREARNGIRFRDLYRHLKVRAPTADVMAACSRLAQRSLGRSHMTSGQIVSTARRCWSTPGSSCTAALQGLVEQRRRGLRAEARAKALP